MTRELKAYKSPWGSVLDLWEFGPYTVRSVELRENKGLRYEFLTVGDDGNLYQATSYFFLTLEEAIIAAIEHRMTGGVAATPFAMRMLKG